MNTAVDTRSTGAEDGSSADDALADEPYHPTYQALMAFGLLGAVYGRHEDADVVAEAVELTLDDPLPYRINHALARSVGGGGAAAVEMLKEYVNDNPDDDGTKVVLAVSMMLSGQAEWQSLIESVLAGSSDPVAREAATNVVAFLLSMRR